MDLVYSAISVPLGIALKELVESIKIIYSSKTSANETKEKLLSLKPIIDDTIQTISDSESKDYSSIHTDGQLRNFQAVLRDGLAMVEEVNTIHVCDIRKRYLYGKQNQDLQMKIKELLDIQGVCRGHDLQKLIAEVRDLRLRSERSTPIDGMPQATATALPSSYTYQVPDMPNYVVGLGKSINKVKQNLFGNDINIVVVTGMGGSGKTTFASALCKDPDVKAFFRERIFFIPVKRSRPNVKAILEIMWDQIIGGRRDFQRIQDARYQLQAKLKLIADQPTLVVLDNVWSRSDLEYLLFEENGYKTVVTTREDSTIPVRNKVFTYPMPDLESDNALMLFCFWAFGDTSIPTILKEKLVKDVAAECNGLPLSLQVIGSSLRDKPPPVWENAKKKLSKAQSVSNYHKDVLKRLQTSIDVLGDEQKACFLDLGAFPEGRTFSVDSLLDIWVYVRRMEWLDAFEVLLEFASRKLLNLIGYPGSMAINSNCASEISFSQHDVMRDLALHLARSDNTRLFMPRKEAEISTEWLNTSTTYRPSDVQFVSIHTGKMEKQDWNPKGSPKFFRKVEVLALFFQADEYCLPTFLQTMPHLKVLIIYNYSSKRATLSGLGSFPPHGQIRSVLLNKLIVPSIFENCRSWERLEKFYVCLCEGPKNIPLSSPNCEGPKKIPLLSPNFPNNVEINIDPFKWLEKLFRWLCGCWKSCDEPGEVIFPNIMEINLDHCSDLTELPVQLCNLTSLQKLSVTNCHGIQNLHDSLERYSSLRVLRLSACVTLSRLPPSICNLRQLEYLDISKCMFLRDLPSEFDQLSNLDTLDMTECSGVKKLPRFNLPSLRIVIVSTDSRTEREWKSLKESTLPDLTIVPVPEKFSVDWLDCI